MTPSIIPFGDGAILASEVAAVWIEENEAKQTTQTLCIQLKCDPDNNMEYEFENKALAVEALQRFVVDWRNALNS